MSLPSEDQLIYDWSNPDRADVPHPVAAMLDDETLRDGLQNPTVVDPSLDEKIEILHLMNDLGIET
ncbi:MAG: 2-isopropylmalate synthase, partial [Gemmatimonadota bacterium]